MRKRSYIVRMLALVVLIAVGMCVGEYLHTQEKPETPDAQQPAPEQPVAEYLFSLDENPVLAVYLQNGSSGKVNTFDSDNDVQWFVAKLKMLRYDEVAESESGAGGWTYRLIVDGMYGDRDFIVGPQYVSESINRKTHTYRLTAESVPIMEEILALMPQ